jgi:hypothetical protein
MVRDIDTDSDEMTLNLDGDVEFTIAAVKA